MSVFLRRVESHGIARPEPHRQAATPVDFNDVAGRVVIVALFSLMTARFLAYFATTGRVTGLFLIASELLVVLLTIVRRPATAVDRSWWARMLTAVAVAGPLLLRPGSASAILPDWASGALALGGLLVVVGGKLCLGRSFGLMPANRGIVAFGMYRLVRHPIYVGYLVTHLAVAIAFPTVQNIVVFIVSDAAQIARALREEKTLSQDPAYAAYAREVQWRLVPGIF